MLHDPKYDRTPSLAGFALFVASREPGERYNWRNCEQCAVGQYLATLGRSIPVSDWTGDLAIANDLARAGYGPGFFTDASPSWTFGALGERLLAFQRAA